jgi:hypothetical protein
LPSGPGAIKPRRDAHICGNLELSDDARGSDPTNLADACRVHFGKPEIAIGAGSNAANSYLTRNRLRALARIWRDDHKLGIWRDKGKLGNLPLGADTSDHGAGCGEPQVMVRTRRDGAGDADIRGQSEFRDGAAWRDSPNAIRG